MDSYLEMILLRQRADSGEERSQSVLEKLKAEIGAAVGKAGQPASAEARREDTELQRDEAELRKAETERWALYASEQQRNAELAQMAAQLSEALREEPMAKRTNGSTEKKEESSGWIRYGVIPAEVRQEEGQEQMNLSMDALSRYFERDARRYPG